jgi:amino acid adenylation domain-containing protein
MVRIGATEDGGEPFEAELVLDVSEDGKDASLRVDAGLFSAEDAARLGEQIETLLAATGREPALPVARAPILPDAERRRLIDEWNATTAAYPSDSTVHALFEAQARATPEATAVVAGAKRLTFRELDAQADAWAGALRAAGVGRDSIVGLRVGRSPELAVGMLAVLKAGGAYLPLDLSLPAARTGFMLEDARVDVLLTTSALRDEVRAAERVVLLLDGPPPRVEPPSPSHVPADPGSLAYVIYTSGSTGTPKGVLVHHRGVVNYLWWAVGFYGATGGSGSPVHSPIAFDLTVTSLIAPLVAGRPVHLLEEHLGVDALAGALREGRDLTLVKLTPSHLDLLRHQLTPDEAAGRTRAFVIGGENLQGAGLTFWQRHAPRTRLINEYGPTETVVGCCIYEVPNGLTIPGSVPIGRPIANTRLYVLDPGMELLPIGVAGELFIGGDGVARGYLNRPELTAERFVPDPFAGGDARLYRTGDRVRYLPDGNLEFLGRLDGQVKVRGYRIELGEVESALASHPDVAEAAATVWRDPVSGPRLVAYITLRHGQWPSADELRDWCGRSLPDYMVPASFEQLARLPLTPNGKVDRSALPAPTVRTRTLVPPRTGLERELCAIWSEVLGVDVGVTDDFFELGGHSLLAVQMIARVRQATGHAPPLPVLLTRPTVEHVAAAIEGGPSRDDDPLLLRVRDGAAAAPFFFMHGDFGGSGFYVRTLARHLEPGQPMYSVRPYRPGGPVSIEEMAAANVELIRSVQPRGPYLLGGNCNGGAVAYEMARLLRRSGEEVPLLVLVNTAHRNAHLEPVRRLADAVGRLRRHDREWQRAFFLRLRESVLRTMESRPYGPGPRGRLHHALWWARTAAATTWRVGRRLATARLARHLGRAVPADEPPPQVIRDDFGMTISDTDEVRRARYRYIDAAMREYLARPSDLDVTLLWWGLSGSFAAEPMLHGEDITRGWESLCRSVEVTVLEDGPDLTPDQRIEILGKAIGNYVRRARERMRIAPPGQAPS